MALAVNILNFLVWIAVVGPILGLINLVLWIILLGKILRRRESAARRVGKAGLPG
jgi:membrane-associated protease RseP (regulator of RpoE activity)